MKIIRHTARDMRQALRAVREQLGEDAVILSSRRTGEGVEVTAAVDFDASTLEANGFSGSPAAQQAPLRQIALAPPASTPEPTPSHAPVVRKSAAVARSSLAITVADPIDLEPAAKFAPPPDRLPTYHTEWISAAAREAVAEHAQHEAAPVLPVAASKTDALANRAEAQAARADAEAARIDAKAKRSNIAVTRTEVPVFRGGATSSCTTADAVIQQAHAETLTPFGPREDAPAASLFQPPAAQPEPVQAPTANDTMGNELKTLRRMLETQLAHLAWNDRTRRAPIQTEMLRELSEIGIIPDLAEHLVRQLPEDTDLTFARRFTIAGLSQYLRVTGDRWLDEGGRVAFVGATGVGKTTTLAKVAVRWVLRHGPRDIALVAGDSVRIGAQDQLQSLAQLLGVQVYTPDSFQNLPELLSQLTQRLVLIDTPGSSVRDAQLGGRLAVLANSASKLETALVLAASTQAGALEETVKHFAAVNPSCCVLTKLDEAASLGGVLSILIRARLPVSYVSEGQRVPEDLRPARALELVSAAVRLAKARGAAADEDLLRRRFGKTAHGIT